MRLFPLALITFAFLASGCIQATNETADQADGPRSSGTVASSGIPTGTPQHTTTTAGPVPTTSATTASTGAPTYPRGPWPVEDPGPGPFPVDVQTERYHLQADHFEIRYHDGRRVAPTAGGHDNVTFGGDPGRDHASSAHGSQEGYQTIEWSWKDDYVEFRLHIYLRSDGTDWWAFESRIYDGYPQGEWLYNETTMWRTPLGETYEATTFAIDHPAALRADGQTAPGGTVVFEGLRLRAFL